MKIDTNKHKYEQKKKDTPPLADIPTITHEIVEETKIEIAKRRAGRQGSPLKDIADATCPVCGSQHSQFRR